MTPHELVSVTAAHSVSLPSSKGGNAMLSPDLSALYTRVGLLFAIGRSVGLLLLGVGWPGVWLWGYAHQPAAHGPHQTLLVHLQQLEFVCGQEFR
jgi:hypothetical protein